MIHKYIWFFFSIGRTVVYAGAASTVRHGSRPIGRTGVYYGAAP